jgi:lambda family phage portal protein
MIKSLLSRIRRGKTAISRRISRLSTRIRAKYDSAQTTHENRNHWIQADGMSADAALSAEVRATLRSRARYEVANNSYARGIVSTLANYVIGRGPRLQLLSPSANLNRDVEDKFARWAESIDLAAKLRTMRMAQTESGEVFGLLTTNELIGPVSLDLKLIEADQVATPFMLASRIDVVDGIEFDADGNPEFYHILKQHPGAGGGNFRIDADRVPAQSVLHLYRAERPGQSRGAPEITSSLPLFAMLRRYTLAVINAAEQAALTTGVIYTDAPPDPTIDAVTPMDEVEFARGTFLTMPFGYKAGQMKAEQPTTVYDQFKNSIINEIARCLNIPFNIAAGNSSDYNYASGRLDHQMFFKAVKIDQHNLTLRVLDRLFDAWLNEAVLISGYLPQRARRLGVDFPKQWFWDGVEHVDPAKEAIAQQMRLVNHTTTLASEYARQGLDWEREIEQRATEVALLKSLDLGPPEPAMVVENEDEDEDED